MRFRPCIDIHNGLVKQIVGSSLRDESEGAVDNFVSQKDGGYYADFYGKDGLWGGHIILLNQGGTLEYERDLVQAKKALGCAPGKWQIGGGVNAGNAQSFLDLGASHVIVTSYVFTEGRICYDRLEKLASCIGKEHLVLDLSCRKTDQGYYIATDRWQHLTQTRLSLELFQRLSAFCDEFLIHAVDVEGKSSGIDTQLLGLLGSWEGCPLTYAGGVSSLADLEQIRALGRNRVDVTIGSALDLFGGKLDYNEVLAFLA